MVRLRRSLHFYRTPNLARVRSQTPDNECAIPPTQLRILNSLYSLAVISAAELCLPVDSIRSAMPDPAQICGGTMAARKVAGIQKERSRGSTPGRKFLSERNQCKSVKVAASIDAEILLRPTPSPAFFNPCGLGRNYVAVTAKEDGVILPSSRGYPSDSSTFIKFHRRPIAIYGACSPGHPYREASQMGLPSRNEQAARISRLFDYESVSLPVRFLTT